MQEAKGPDYMSLRVRRGFQKPVKTMTGKYGFKEKWISDHIFHQGSEHRRKHYRSAGDSGENLRLGEAVSLAAPPEVTGYEAAGVTIEQGTSNLLHAQLNPGNDYGTVTGIMPNQDVTIDYEYRKVNSSIRFEANGGNSADLLP